MQGPATDLVFNGVNGSTGEYLFPQLPVDAVARAALGEKIDPAHYRNLQQLLRSREPGHLGVMEHINPEVLAEAGWGLIVSADCDPRILAALQPLRDHRKAEASAINPVRYKEFVGPLAYRPGESSDRWLARQGVAPGPADPDRGVPYYLLIVAAPDEIPFRFQYHLDVQYAVGRIYFATIEEYRRYAESVVAAEQQRLVQPQRVTLAGITNGTDRSTALSSAHLLTPLAETLSADLRFRDWLIERVDTAEATTKHGMLELIGGSQAPPLLFTTSHGMGFDPGDPRQFRHQGALLCRDWPGWEAWGRRPIPTDFYLSADDIGASARVWGRIFFHFACYSAGTPQEDDFSHHALLSERPLIAPHPFVASLPQRLLGHDAGGALAVIGHVDRAWTWSFRWQRVDSSVTVFADVIKRLMRGQRVGHALEAFNERYGQIAASLSTELEDIRFGKIYDPMDLADLWTANNDARAYVIIGDPAVRLVFAPDTAGDTANQALELPRAQPLSAAPDAAAVQPEPVLPPPTMRSHMSSDRIILRNMQFFGYHGTRPEERSLGQRFVVDITLHLDLRAAGTSDDLNQTVDYSAVHRIARAIVEGPPLQLTEAVAERIAAAVLAEHQLVEQIDVTVGKPGVRLDDTVLDGSFVAISRRRG